MQIPSLCFKLDIYINHVLKNKIWWKIIRNTRFKSIYKKLLRISKWIIQANIVYYFTTFINCPSPKNINGNVYYGLLRYIRSRHWRNWGPDSFIEIRLSVFKKDVIGCTCSECCTKIWRYSNDSWSFVRWQH